MIIGGEFEIDLNALGKFNIKPNFITKLPNAYFYSSGRAALYHILNFLKETGNQRILLPDYLCESIIEIVKASNFSYGFYHINCDLSIDFDSIYKKYTNKSSILIINYFGGIEISYEINKIKEVDPNAIIILDNVQSFNNTFENPDVDFNFTSFRKFLPVPDGAVVISKHKLKKCNGKNTFAQYKFAAGLLKKFRKYEAIRDDFYLKLYKIGEKKILSNINATISDISLSILSQLEIELINKKRKENTQYLIRGLKNLGVTPILDFEKENMVPLFVPILIRNRDYLQTELKKHSIFCPVHWPKTNDIIIRDDRLYQEELSIIVDQRYNLKIMEKMLNIIETFINEKHNS